MIFSNQNDSNPAFASSLDDAAYSSEHHSLQTEDNRTILDTPEQWQSFSKVVPNPNAAIGNEQVDLIESQFLFEGLHCAACSGIIEQGLAKEKGIHRVRVSMSKKRGVVLWSPELTKPSAIIQAVEGLGYQANPASHLTDQVAVAKQKRTAFWRWMVAGFCAMQVMMYSVPSYFSSTISADMAGLLNWASWLLSLPVLLFSAATFFRNAWQDLTHQRISMDLPVALGILITFVVSSAATFDPNGWWGSTVYFDTMTMLVFFLLSARFIEARLHSKTMGALEVLLNRIPESTLKRQSDGSVSRILNTQLAQHDIVKVNTGEAFPADGNILAGTTTVDESLLTGESKAIFKSTGDTVIAGSFNLGQSVDVKVTQLGDATQFGQIMQLINQAATEKPTLTRLIDRIAKPFLLVVLLSAAIACALLWQQDHALALMTAAAVLIVTCPCALSLATPAAMLASASALVKNGVLIKQLQSLEDLASIDTIVFDKTGTLTNDQIEITNIQTFGHLSDTQVLNLAASLATHSKHPISRAITNKQIKDNTPSPFTLSNIQEHAGLGIEGHIDELNSASKQSTLRLGNALFCRIEKNDLTEPSKQQLVYLAQDGQLLASFTLKEQVKTGAQAAINALQKEQFAIALLSGDQQHTVQQLAAQLGIHEADAMCSPAEKLSRIHQLQQQGKKVLMVGDGLNDGPVLASAHVSIAMGKGVPLTHAHADYILLNGDIGLIPHIIAQAKKTMRVIKQNITWAIVYNAICIPLAFFGLINAWQAGLGMAISSLVVVLNAMRLSALSRVD